MSIYKKKKFFPNVRPDWGGILDYISDSEKAEILTAIIKYPNYQCDSKFWQQTIKPDIDEQYEKFCAVCEQARLNRAKGDARQPTSTPVTRPSTDVNNSQPTSTGVDDLKIKKEIEIKEKIEKEIGGVGEKKKITEQTEFIAGHQGWQFPFDFLPLANKYWTTDTIRNIEKDFACKEYDTKVTIGQLLLRYPKDKGKANKTFVAPTVEELIAFCKTRGIVEKAARKAYDYYSTANWCDSTGKRILNWKQKIIAVWDKPENKIEEKEDEPFYI